MIMIWDKNDIMHEYFTLGTDYPLIKQSPQFLELKTTVRTEMQ